MSKIEDKNIILVTGIPRSGTSMTAGIIHACDAFGGITSGPTKNNQKGMFENIRIRERIVKPYLRDLGLDSLGQYPLPDINKLSIPNDWRSRIEQVFIDEGYKSGKVFYKGAKMTILWPLFHHAFPTAKWVIVRRRTGDIIQSCLKTSFMRAFRSEQFRKAVGAKDEREGWLWWVHEHEKRFVEMINEGLNCKIIWPDRMVRGDYSQLYDTLEWLGLKWDVSKILNFVDPKLWHSRKDHPYANKVKPKKVKSEEPKIETNKVIQLTPEKEPFNPIRIPARG